MSEKVTQVREGGEGQAQHRADYSDARSYSPMEPTYGTLSAAQRRCEEDLRAARDDGDQLVFTWRSDTDDGTDPREPVLWQMLVRTPRLRESVTSGFSVTLVGSVFDGLQPGDHGSEELLR